MKLETLITEPNAKFATCSATDTLDSAAKVMLDHHLHALMVSDEAGKLVGIVTDHDIMRTLVETGNKLDDTHVKSAMSRDVITCPASLTLQGALLKMGNFRIRHLVVEHAGSYSIVSVKDILEKLHRDEDLEIRVLKDIALATKASI